MNFICRIPQHEEFALSSKSSNECPEQHNEHNDESRIKSKHSSFSSRRKWTSSATTIFFSFYLLHSFSFCNKINAFHVTPSSSMSTRTRSLFSNQQPLLLQQQRLQQQQQQQQHRQTNHFYTSTSAPQVAKSRSYDIQTERQKSKRTASSPSSSINFYDLEEIVRPKPTYTINVEAEASSSIMEKKIVHLLHDDDGEEDHEIPDYSEAAANEIADKSTYSRISEEAKLKANIAMQKKIHKVGTSALDDPDSNLFGDDDHHGSMTTTYTKTMKKRRTFTASVKETGVDTMSQYVKSMGSHELLPKESEILLGRQIQILVSWENVRLKLEETLESPPTFAQWSEALGVTVPELKKQIRKSQRAKAALIEANLRLVVTVARQTVKKVRSEINLQDACQEGIIGLNRACEKYDPEKGFRFSTYAIWWIKREVRKNLLEQSRSVRLPTSAIKKINDIRINERLLTTTLGRKPTDDEVAQKCNMTVKKVQFYRRKAMDATSLDKELSGGKGGKGSSASGIESNGKTIGNLVKDLSPTPSEIANKEMLQNDVRRLIKTLSPREQAVIRLRFGLDDGVPRTLDYIGKKFEVDKDRIRKIEAKALLKLRQPYRNQSVKCYVPDL
mmetsp:Transcript_12348/g.15237  ORF Transcript_12348/g.15237 Transcript_12348/m.15237 type:complete len:615 (+) Transcript_12348:167-2011(+)